MTPLEQLGLAPHHRGRFEVDETSVVHARVIDPASGSAANLSLKLEGGDRVVEARFACFASAPLLGGFSVLCGAVAGQRLSQRRQFDPQALLRAHGATEDEAWVGALFGRALEGCVEQLADVDIAPGSLRAEALLARSAAQRREAEMAFFSSGLSLVAADRATVERLLADPPGTAGARFDLFFDAALWPRAVAELRAGQPTALAFGALQSLVETAGQALGWLEWPVPVGPRARRWLREALLADRLGSALAAERALGRGYLEHRPEGLFEFGHLPASEVRQLLADRASMLPDEPDQALAAAVDLDDLCADFGAALKVLRSLHAADPTRFDLVLLPEWKLVLRPGDTAALPHHRLPVELLNPSHRQLARATR